MQWLRWELMAAKILYNQRSLPRDGKRSLFLLRSCSGSLCCCLWVGPRERACLVTVSPGPLPRWAFSKKENHLSFWLLPSALSPNFLPKWSILFLGLLRGAYPQQLPHGALDTVTLCSPFLPLPCPHAMPSSCSLLATVAPARLLPPFGRTCLRKCRCRTQLCSCTSPKLQEAHPDSPRNSPACSDPLQRECSVRQRPFLLLLRLGKQRPGWRCQRPFPVG